MASWISELYRYLFPAKAAPSGPKDLRIAIIGAGKTPFPFQVNSGEDRTD